MVVVTVLEVLVGGWWMVGWIELMVFALEEGIIVLTTDWWLVVGMLVL